MFAPSATSSPNAKHTTCGCDADRVLMLVRHYTRDEKQSEIISIAIAAYEAQHKQLTRGIATDLLVPHSGSCVKSYGGGGG